MERLPGEEEWRSYQEMRGQALTAVLHWGTPGQKNPPTPGQVPPLHTWNTSCILPCLLGPFSTPIPPEAPQCPCGRLAVPRG